MHNPWPLGHNGHLSRTQGNAFTQVSLRESLKGIGKLDVNSAEITNI